MAVSQKQGWFFNASKSEGNTATIVIEGTVGGYNWDAETWEEFIQNRKQAFRKKLKNLINEGVDTIYVDIDSMGGLLNHGIAIHDLLAGFKGEVITTTYGMTASAATIIAQAASKGKRRISANSFYLIHKAMVRMFYANSNDLETMLKENKAIDKTIKEIYKKNTSKANGKKIDRLFEENGGHGIWIDAYEAQAHGLVDEVIEPKESGAVNWGEMANKRGLPSIPEELMNKVLNYGVPKNEAVGTETKEEFDMNFIEKIVTEVVNKLKGKEVNEETAKEVANSFTAEEMEEITNAVVGDAIKPLQERINAVENQETEETPDIKELVTNAVAEAMKAYSNEDVTKLTNQVSELEKTIKNLSGDDAENKANDLPLQSVGNGTELKLENAAEAGGFTIEVEV